MMQIEDLKHKFVRDPIRICYMQAGLDTSSPASDLEEAIKLRCTLLNMCFCIRLTYGSFALLLVC